MQSTSKEPHEYTIHAAKSCTREAASADLCMRIGDLELILKIEVPAISDASLASHTSAKEGKGLVNCVSPECN